MVKRIIIDHFLRRLLPEECKAVGMRSAQTPRKMVEALMCAPATLSTGRGKQRDNLPGLLQGQAPQRLKPGLHWKRRHLESLPTYETPRDEPMPTGPGRAPTQ